MNKIPNMLPKKPKKLLAKINKPIDVVNKKPTLKLNKSATMLGSKNKYE